jgi:hypothetical protein
MGCSPDSAPLATLQFRFSCVYAVTSTTICVLPASFHAHTHIDQHKYKRILSSDLAVSQRFPKEGQY